MYSRHISISIQNFLGRGNLGRAVDPWYIQNGLDLQSFAVGFDAGLNFLSPLAQTEFLALVYFLISDFLKLFIGDFLLFIGNH